MNVYSQIDSLGFYIGTQADVSVSGAIGTPPPELQQWQRARWTGDSWDIRTIEEWELILAPVDPVSTVPHQVTRAQGKAALVDAGLYDAITDYIASIEDRGQRLKAEFAFHDALYYQRSSPFLNQAAEALGVSQAQLDELFLTASKIEL